MQAETGQNGTEPPAARPKARPGFAAPLGSASRARMAHKDGQRAASRAREAHKEKQRAPPGVVLEAAEQGAFRWAPVTDGVMRLDVGATRRAG